jgi:hypothetical protein
MRVCVPVTIDISENFCKSSLLFVTLLEHNWQGELVAKVTSCRIECLPGAKILAPSFSDEFPASIGTKNDV